MRIVFAGTPEFAVPSLLALVRSGHEVVGVITRADAPLGRKRVFTPSPVARVAEELGIAVYKANSLDAAATEWVAALNPELGVIVAYGGLVRDPLLNLPNHGWINLHFSDLPRWRGAAPVQRALMAGEQHLGVTVFRLVAALDAGDVLMRDAKTFAPGTSSGAALTELAEFGTTAILGAVHLLEQHPDAGVAQIGEANYAHKLDRADGKLCMADSTSQVLAHWAGVTPEPGAYVECEGSPLKILEMAPVEYSELQTEALPGTVRLVSGSAQLILGDGALQVLRVQPAGKQAMAATDWLRGRGGEAVFV